MTTNTLCQIQIQKLYKFNRNTNTKIDKYKNLTNTNAYPHNFTPPFNALHINLLVDIHTKHKLWLASDKSISTVSFIN